MNEPIRVAIAGVGNCAAALVKAVAYYRQHEPDGAITPTIGRLGPGDIEFVAAFDVDERKVDIELRNAINAPPNCVPTAIAPIYAVGGAINVNMGQRLDGIAPHMADFPAERAFRPASRPACDVARVLAYARAEVLVNYMPVGADLAARFYAGEALTSGCAFVNAMPSFIASDPDWSQRFEAAALPLIGDDVKSQFGATYVHRALVKALADRGCTLIRTYQLNTGGNTDFLNMLDRSRLASKKRSKTQSVCAEIDPPIEAGMVHIGPSDYVPWQGDNKIAFIRLEATGCIGAPIELELRLSVQDSPNSAGVVLDAIRFAGMARRKAVGGVLDAPSAWLMKSPRRQLADGLAKRLCDLAADGDLSALSMP
jgi:myo-inositol-1-phosphate synthase